MAENNKANFLEFPENFLWGASTSAYQVEGGIVNDWSRWEKTTKRKEQLKAEGKNPADFIAGKACNSYEMFSEDLRCIKELNLNSYRLSIEWSRVEPQENEFDTMAISYYREMLRQLKENGITTVVTLWHWTNPIWLAEKGGWENRGVVAHFSKYVNLMAYELKGLVDYWVTLNEPMVPIVNGYVTGVFPPNKRRSLCKARKVFKNMTEAHRKAYGIIHNYNRGAKVSITNLTNYYEPAHKWCTIEKLIVKAANYFGNYKFFKDVINQIDYIGVDYYFHDRIVWWPPFKKNLNHFTSDIGWEIYPEGIYQTLKFLKKFNKPIIVMENGLADAEDRYRESFIREHLKFIHQAIAEGVPVQGYFHWSLLDNFEWDKGFGPKFGLCEVDRATFQRRLRPSARAYGQIIKENGLWQN